MKYNIGTIVQFKKELNLIDMFGWNKGYAKIAGNKIGRIEKVGARYYLIRLVEDDTLVAADEDSIFLPSGFVIKEE